MINESKRNNWHYSFRFRAVQVLLKAEKQALSHFGRVARQKSRRLGERTDLKRNSTLPSAAQHFTFGK